MLMHMQKVDQVKVSNTYLHFILFFYSFILVMSQWLYLYAVGKGALEIKIISSLFLWSIMITLIPPFVLQGGKIKIEKTELQNKIHHFTLLYATSLLVTVLLAFSNPQGWAGALEGLKALFAVLAGVRIMNLAIGHKLNLLLVVAPIYFLSLTFGVIQIYEKVGFFTGNSFFTEGAVGRWWDLHAIWGTMGLYGKNIYGLALSLCLAIVIPLRNTIKTNWLRVITKYVSIPLSIICIYRSESRTALVCVILIVLMETVYLSRENNSVSGILFLTFCGTSLLTWLMVSRGSGNWLFSSNSLAARSIERYAVASAKWSDWLFGSGFNGIFRLTNNSFGATVRSGNASLGVNVDNAYLRTILEGGVFGLVSLMALLVVLFQCSRSQIPRINYLVNSDVMRSLRYLTLTFCLCALTIDLLSFQTSIAILFFFIGLVVSQIYENSKP